jgi:predicted dehydrogenase
VSGVPSPAQLIAQAKRLIRTGAIGTVTLTNGLALPPTPLAIMSLVPRMCWFTFIFDDHAHGIYVTRIYAGDDAEVFVAGDQDETLEIHPVWNAQQTNDLEYWLASTKVHQVYLAAGNPPPPDIVRYEGSTAR